MLIGNRYVSNKLYRGIRVSNNLPLIAEDLHEFSDTLAEKSNQLLESILGSGIIKPATPLISKTGIGLSAPATVNIEGDICLIGNSESTNLIDISALEGDTSGTIFIVGFYTHITATDTIKEFGGMMNSTLDNNLLYEPLGIQVSSRYQFIWDAVVLKGELKEDFSLELIERDIDGNPTSMKHILKPTSKVGSVYKTNAPTNTSYEIVSDIYMIPFLEYSYNSESATITEISSFPERKTSSSGTVITLDTEPTGNFNTGDVWYNPISGEFKTYIEGKGFVSSTTKVGYVQYQFINVATEDITTPQNLTYEVDVPSIYDTDMIRVTYEGLELVDGVDYQIDYTNKRITLLNFIRYIGQRLVVTVNRLVEVNDVTSLSTTITTHIDIVGNDKDRGHLKLSDSIDSDENVNSGVAATPKAVKESRYIIDDTTGKKYRIGVNNGEIYASEVL